jgi:hypothetical protein
MAAETADDYFNYGAQDYIFGEKEKAKTQILTGLQQYPQDPKLNGVIRLLQRKEQPPPPNQSKPKNGEKGEKQDQKDQSGQSAQQKKDQDKEKQDQAKKDKEQKEKEKEQKEAQANPSDKRDKNPENGEQMAEATMSPQEARQLLDAQQDNEKILIFAPSNQPAATLSAKIKDW